MKQAYVPETGKIQYRDIEKPVIEPGYVIIRVSRIGICGSDVHVFKGKHPIVKAPLVQGHEISGYIEEIGRGITDFREGDLVTIQPAIGCGKCKRCIEGKFAQCENLNFIGSDKINGAGSEYFKVKAEQVLKMPKNVDPDDAAMVEPLAVAVHSVRKVPSIKGKNVLITGGGVIGVLVAQVARKYKAKNIIISEIIPGRNEIVKKCGFISINPTKIDSFKKELEKNLSSEYLEVAFECSGSEAALNTCVREISRGGYIIVVGVYEADSINVEMVRVQDKEINLIGSLMYTWDDFYEAINLLANKEVNLKILQTHHFKFDKWIEGYKVIEEKPNEVMKVLIDFF